MTEPLMWTSASVWPFRGALLGRRGGLAWAGRVAAGTPLQHAFDVARMLHETLDSGDRGERRAALSAAWDRLMAAPLGQDASSLSLLLISEDAEGVSVSAVGLSRLYACGQGPARQWIGDGHPLYSEPGVPSERPSALSVKRAPPLVVGVCGDDTLDDAPTELDALRRRCGVWP